MNIQGGYKKFCSIFLYLLVGIRKKIKYKRKVIHKYLRSKELWPFFYPWLIENLVEL